MPKLDSIAPLFVPADRPEFLAKAAALPADAVIIDLEDAVAPAQKSAARAALRGNFTSKPIWVRINPAGTTWHEPDIEAVKALAISAIMLPKADYNSLLATARNWDGPVIALVETALGLAQARQIALHPQVERLAFGSLDYCAHIGCSHTREALLMARSAIIHASALAGIAGPLDGVTVSLKDLSAVESDARYAAELGFTGKLCIHPAQIKPVLNGFAPAATDISWARKTLTADAGAAQLDGMMIDAPVRMRAQSILDRMQRTSGAGP